MMANKHHRKYRMNSGFRQREKEYAEEYQARPEVKTHNNERDKKKYREDPEFRKRKNKCSKKYSKSKLAKNALLKRTYGITLEQYDQMFDQQNGVCAICGGTNSDGKRLSVDHNHTTNKVRKLLCQRCNVGLGFIEDGIFMAKAKLYLVELQ